MDISRWSRKYRPSAARTLALRRPDLRNSGQTFDESYVLVGESPKTVTTPGAIEIQNAFETLEWLQAEGDPASFAAHLKTSPLKGVPEKNILWQYGLGDQTVPNNTQTALVRYADMKSSAWIYRHDLARRVSTSFDPDPHIYFVNPSGAAAFVMVATQLQMLNFLIDQPYNPNANVSFIYGADLFEQPDELPEGLNYLEQ